jgi:outer membrane protein assembly factor BamB
LKDRLAAEPNNEALKGEIRRLDFEFRRNFRRRLSTDASGAVLLVAGSLLAVSAAKRWAGLRQVPVVPSGAISELAVDRPRALRAVLVTAGAVTASLGVAAWAVSSGLTPRTTPSATAAASVEETPPTAAELAANWVAFRGWDGTGATSTTNIPLAWDGSTGAGVAWKIPTPAPGHNTPIVWRDRLFFTGATADKREVFAVEAGTGRILWRIVAPPVVGSAAKAIEVGESTGFAASTGATDGRRYYAIFPNGDLVAVRFDGTIAWTRALGPLENSFGHASSLVYAHGMVLAQLDQGEASKPASKLVALDAVTGRVRWERSRPVPASWATPVVFEVAGKSRVAALGDPWIIGYALDDGAELWRAGLLQSEIVPSPIFANGFVIAASPSKLYALRPDGSGDVTKTAVAWASGDNAPDVTCPAASAGLVFNVTSSGDLTCIDATDGRKVWDHALNLEVQASPVILGDRLLVLGADGAAVQVAVAREYREAGRGRLVDRFFASPAVVGDGLFLRGTTNLYCVKTGAGGRKGQNGGN